MDIFTKKYWVKKLLNKADYLIDNHVPDEEIEEKLATILHKLLFKSYTKAFNKASEKVGYFFTGWQGYILHKILFLLSFILPSFTVNQDSVGIKFN